MIFIQNSEDFEKNLYIKITSNWKVDFNIFYLSGIVI